MARINYHFVAVHPLTWCWRSQGAYKEKSTPRNARRIYPGPSEPLGSHSVRDHSPHDRHRRRVQHTIWHEHGVIDISRWASSLISPMWNIQRPPARHLLRSPEDDTTLCDHPWRAGNTVEHTYIEGESIECTDCTTRVSKN